MVAPGILAVALFLSFTWGLYLLGTIRMYQKVPNHPRRREDVVVAMRRFVVAFCLWLFIFSFVFRSVMVLAGFGEDFTGQVVFFALLGSNVVGSIYCCISLWFD